MMKVFRIASLAASVVCVMALWSLPALAQDEVVQSAPKKAKPAAVQKDSEVDGRLNQLEEQLIDMQVVVGTLESIARKGIPAASLGDAGGDGGARIARLEAQMQRLLAEIKALSVQVQAMSGQPANVAAVEEAPALPGFGPAEDVAAAPGSGGDLALPADAGAGQSGDQISSILTDEVPAAGGSGTDFASVENSVGSVAPAEVPAAADNQVEISGEEPEKIYETAYGFLLQQDYDQAERAFTGFLGKFPKDKLAGNAQYWLGETHYVRGQYGPAAKAFLAGYSKYRKGPKAPDSLLKLAMSLSRLGQKEQSCASFSELETSFPALSAQLKKRSAAERERAGC